MALGEVPFQRYGSKAETGLKGDLKRKIGELLINIGVASRKAILRALDS